jgi:hypothetical protein
MFKKFPISKFVYDSQLYYIAVSQTLNLNNSANLKQNLIIFLVVYQGPRWNYSVKKKGGEKSRQTVPLTCIFVVTVACIFILQLGSSWSVYSVRKEFLKWRQSVQYHVHIFSNFAELRTCNEYCIIPGNSFTACKMFFIWNLYILLHTKITGASKNKKRQSRQSGICMYSQPVLTREKVFFFFIFSVIGMTVGIF